MGIGVRFMPVGLDDLELLSPGKRNSEIQICSILYSSTENTPSPTPLSPPRRQYRYRCTVRVALSLPGGLRY